jgi:hypothetical protein
VEKKAASGSLGGCASILQTSSPAALSGEAGL